jgi:hypothetical protein
MQKHFLALTAGAFLVACGTTAASAQGPMVGQPAQPQTQTAPGTGQTYDAGWLHRRAGRDRPSDYDADDLRSNGHRWRWLDRVAGVSGGARTNFQSNGHQQGWPPYAGGAGNLYAWNIDSRADAREIRLKWFNRAGRPTAGPGARLCAQSGYFS